MAPTVITAMAPSIKRLAWATSLISAALRSLVCSVLCLIALYVIGLFVPLSEAMRWAVILIFLTPAPFILTLYARSEQERADVSMSLSLQHFWR